MAKGNFKAATGKNEDIVAMVELEGTIYVATASSIYKFRHSGDDFHELVDVDFEMEATTAEV